MKENMRKTTKEDLEDIRDHADDAENVEGDEQDNHIPEFLLKELSSAIDSLKRGKSTDSTGIRVEDLKAAHEEATKMIHEVFNLIVKQNSMTNSMTPSSWKTVMVTVIYKIGDPTKPENYRPICSVPMLHKLFSIVYNRFSDKLDHFPDQAGFRIKFQATDHLMTNRLFAQKSREW